MGIAEKLVVAAAMLVATGVAGPGPASLRATWSGATGALIGTSTPWAVTVGPPSRTLFPGLDADIPYTVENKGPGTLFLHGARVQLRNDGVGIYDTNTNSYVDGCLVSWFRAAVDRQPVPAGGGEVDAGATVSGTVDIAFDDAPVSQDACRDVALAVEVTAD